MKKLIFKILILTVVSSLILAYVFDPIFRDSNANSKTFDEFYKSNNDSLDIIIIGSSHAKNAYFPRVIDSVFNTKSYNLSTGGQNYLTTNLLLENVLKEAKPKLVIIDLFPVLMQLPKAAKPKGDQLKVIDYIALNQRKIKVINKIYNFNEFPSVFSETMRNHDKWFNRNWSLEEFPVENERFIFHKGYFNSVKVIDEKDREKYKDFIIEQEKYLKVFPSKKELLNFEKDYSDIIETIRICKDNNIKVLFVSAPYFDSFYRDGLNKKHYLFKNFFSKTSDITYLDFNTKFNELGLEFEDYWDNGHLNIKGSYKTTINLTRAIDSLGYFKIKNRTYYLDQLKKVTPRDISAVEREINKSLKNSLNGVYNNGKIYNINHVFYKELSINKEIFSIDGNYRQIVFECNQPFSENFEDFYFLLSKTINKSDFDKRPKWQLGTDKNKLHWEVIPEKMTVDNKNYIILTLDKKCEITNFDEVRIVLKNKETKASVGRPLVIKNVSIKK